MSRRLHTPLVLVLLFLAAWVPRTLALEQFVTIDERKWLARSANFYQAITQADWPHTFQREHPGVTVMWAGTLALALRYPTYPQEAPGQFTWEREHFEAWISENTAFTPLELLAAGRRVIVVAISLAIALGYLPLRRLLGARWAALATRFVAWDPFAVAMSQQLHPDGFVSVLSFLALLLVLAWLYGGRRWRYLLTSAVIMGLAWLTKTPAIFLVPTGAILVALSWWRSRTTALRSPISDLRSLPTGFLLWGALATVTFVVLWPAMWLDPFGTLLRMSAEMSEYVERHTTINYFWGRPVDDPGPLFYPVAFLFRTTPAVLVGLVGAAIAAWRRAKPFDQPITRQLALGLFTFALVLTLGMTIGAKKFDRYLLPAFPALDVLAALGWVAVGHWGMRRLGDSISINLPISSILLLAAFLIHGLLGFVHYPYYLTYYNPLTGGARTASLVLFAGWGEGLDQAARWLNAQPNAENLRVVAWYADGPFSYFFRGQEVTVGESSPLYWLDTDYTVVYVNQWQRQLPSPEAIAYFAEQTPVYSVRNGGLDLVHIYDLRNTLLPEFVDIGKESVADFGGQIRLSAYEIPQMVIAPGNELPITLYLQSLAPMTVNYNALVRLIDQNGDELWREDRWPWGAPTSDWPLREIRPDGHTVVIPAEAAPGLYKLTLSFYDPATFAPLPVTAIGDDQVLDAGTRDITLLWAGEPPTPPADTAEWRFGELFELTDATIPPNAQPGTELPVQLQWQSLARTATDYTVFVHVVDASGVTVAQRDGQPLGGWAPTRLWTPEIPLADEHRIPLPADLPPGEYEVRVGLYTLADGRLPVSTQAQPAGDYARIGTLTIP
jgi:hypothetical protein